MMMTKEQAMHGTTILCVHRDGKVAMGGDGQVTLGDIIIKSSTQKIRTLAGGRVLAGFAGATADAFTLLERFEKKLETHNHQLGRAAEDLARDWRTDRVLRHLQAMLIISDIEQVLVLSGLGDVLSPENGVASIGSGSAYARSAALALLSHAPHLSVRDVVDESLRIAADICIYSNHCRTIKEL